MDARLVSVNGVKKIQINGEVFEPIAFRSFWPAAHTTRRFHETGMRLMTVFPTGILCSLKVPYSQFGEVWVGEGAYDWQALRKHMDQFVENAPDAYFALMLQLDTRDWFLKDHPEAGDSFFQIANAAGWDLWREQASQYIRDMLDYLDREYPEKIYSVFVCAGSTCEWINRMPVTYQNPVKKRAFAAWTGGRETPSDEALERASHGMFRDPAQDQAALDYWRFHNEIVADAICHFAKVVKEHSARRLLVGCFYGYVQYCAGGPTASGHQAAHRVFACPDVDMIFSPATYVHRGLESTSGEQLPADSVILNGKLYFCEIDNTAFPANGNPYAQVLQTYAHRRHKSLEETIHYSRREAALTLSRGGAYWWFDMFGGWYDDDRLMAELQKIRRATGRVYAGPVRPVAEVAVLLDAQSYYYCTRDAVIRTELVVRQRETLGQMGCPFDVYQTDDLFHPDFDLDRYKLLIFPDCYAPTSALREKVKALRGQGKCMLFQYAAGAIGPKGFSEANMRDFTGIALREAKEAASHTVVPAGLLNDDGMTRIYAPRQSQAEPALACADPEARVFGHDLLTKDGQLAVKDRPQGGFDAWSHFGPLPPFVLRPLARAAGVHIYQADNLPVYANSRLVALFDHEGGERLLDVPLSKGRLTELYTGETHALGGAPIGLTFGRNECKCFLVEEGAP